MEITLTKEIKLEPEHLAELFCDMDGGEQAVFFSHIKTITDTWLAPFCFQLQGIAEDPDLTAGGRKIMEQIGRYASHKGE